MCSRLWQFREHLMIGLSAAHALRVTSLSHLSIRHSAPYIPLPYSTISVAMIKAEVYPH